MTTLYRLLENLCGLSHREAAAFHRVREDTVKSWASGRNAPRDEVYAELRQLYASIQNAATHALDTIREAPAGAVIELGYAADDYEAQQIGWPCVGAQRAMLAMVAVALPAYDVRVVPRGSTPGTAAAADAHDAG